MRYGARGLSLRAKLIIIAAAILALLVAGAALYHRAYQAGVADRAVTEAATRIEEAKKDAKQAEERGDGAWLYRDILDRARKPLPR